MRMSVCNYYYSCTAGRGCRGPGEAVPALMLLIWLLSSLLWSGVLMNEGQGRVYGLGDSKALQDNANQGANVRV